MSVGERALPKLEWTRGWRGSGDGNRRASWSPRSRWSGSRRGDPSRGVGRPFSGILLTISPTDCFRRQPVDARPHHGSPPTGLLLASSSARPPPAPDCRCRHLVRSGSAGIVCGDTPRSLPCSGMMQHWTRGCFSRRPCMHRAPARRLPQELEMRFFPRKAPSRPATCRVLRSVQQRSLRRTRRQWPRVSRPPRPGLARPSLAPSRAARQRARLAPWPRARALHTSKTRRFTHPSLPQDTDI